MTRDERRQKIAELQKEEAAADKTNFGPKAKTDDVIESFRKLASEFLGKVFPDRKDAPFTESESYLVQHWINRSLVDFALRNGAHLFPVEEAQTHWQDLLVLPELLTSDEEWKKRWQDNEAKTSGQGKSPTSGQS